MPNVSYLTPEMADRIRQLDATGIMRKDIAKALGVSGPTVNKVCRRFEIPNRLTVFVTPEVADRVRELISQGMRRADIAKSLGCSRVTLNKTCRRFNIPDAPHFAPNKGRKDALRADVLSMVEGGMKHKDVARQLRCGKRTVTAILREDNPWRYGGRGSKKNVLALTVPSWVPEELAEEYSQKTLLYGEEVAARWAREAKREMKLVEACA